VVLAGVLDDGGANGRPIVVVPWVEASQRPYSEQVAEVASLARMWSLTVFSETNGVGAAPSEVLAGRLGARTRVHPVTSTLASKEGAYGRLAVLVAERSIVLPRHEGLLRQLGGLSAQPTPTGGLRIGARVESLHDDLPDALALAVSGLPRELLPPKPREVEAERWVVTPGGVRVPVPVQTASTDVDWVAVWTSEAPVGGVGDDDNPWLAVYGSTPARA
jgi:hypothetical protein